MVQESALAVWSGEENARHRVRCTVVRTPDGGVFRVTRVGAGRGTPVVMLPGMFDNRRLYLWPGGGGLAEELAGAGFDAWVVERRGTGGMAHAPSARAGWEEVVSEDLPAVQRLVATETGRAAFWIGHSFGGVALARAVTDGLLRSEVAGLVLINAAVDIPILANRLAAAALGSRWWRNGFPARRFRIGPEDEPLAAMQDAILWSAAERSRGLLSVPLGTVELPVLALTAPRDVVAPAARCGRLAASFAGGDLRVQSASRGCGFARAHSHESPLLHPGAASDVFPFIRGWLAARCGQSAPADQATADSTGRHRVHFRLQLDAAPERVFHVLTRQWSTLWPVRQRRVRDGVDAAEPDGLRSVRGQKALGIWPIQEEIVTHVAPRLIEYRTIRGPVRNHLGRIELSPAPGGGTSLDYVIAFDTARWIPGALLAVTLDMTWRRWSVPRLRRLTATG